VTSGVSEEEQENIQVQRLQKEKKSRPNNPAQKKKAAKEGNNAPRISFIRIGENVGRQAQGKQNEKTELALEEGTSGQRGPTLPELGSPTYGETGTRKVPNQPGREKKKGAGVQNYTVKTGKPILSLQPASSKRKRGKGGPAVGRKKKQSNW